MKKALKKILSSILVAVMILTAVPLSGFVGLKLNFDWLDLSTDSSALESNGLCGEDVAYTFDETTGLLTISGYGDMDDDSSFAFEHSIKTVVIEDGVISISSGAFYSCDGITSITISKSVSSIGDSAFHGCTGLTSITVDEKNQYYSSDEYGVLFDKDKTELIKYPEGNSRTSYTIPDSVTSIGNSAFLGCECLTNITIPASVASIGDSAFCGCTGLTCITVDEKNQYYSSDEYGVLFNKDKKELIQYPIGNSRTTYIIPNSVISIDGYAFNSCTGLTSVTIPNSVLNIGNRAFGYCTGLTSVTIPDSVASIGDCAFEECRGLTRVTIGKSVRIIPYFAFAGCTELTWVTIENGVRYIRDSAFSRCTGLKDVFYSGTEDEWNNIKIGSNTYLTNATIHYGVYSGDAVRKFFEEQGSDIIIDPETNCIYGIEPGSTSLNGDGSIGTGTKLSIVENGTATEYTVVIFGDTDGDGLYDGTDSVIVNCLANGMLTKEQVGDAAYSAADCNHDGVVDSLDVALLEQAGISASTIAQTK